MTEQRQSFSALLSLRPVEGRKDAFENEQLWQPKGARGVFGGQVIGLALMAALQTIDTSKFGLHSQHCYFILPASSSEKMVIEVDRLRDGKSYATRLVRVKQGHGMVFILAASYTVHPIPLPEGLMERADQVASDMEHLKLGLASNGESPEHWDNGGAIKGNDQEVIIGDEPRVTDSRSSSSDNHDHSEINSSTSRQKVVKKKQESSIPTFSPSFQIPFPVGVIPYEQCEEEQVRWTKFLEKVGQGYDRKKQGWINGYIQERKESAVSIAVTRHRYQSDSAYKSSSVRMVWLKPRLGEDEKPDIETVKAMIGYMTDFHFIGTASRAIGLSSSSNPRLGMMASLDHTVHYYPFPSDFNAGDPLLHVMETVVVDIAAGRAVVRGLVYTQDGVLVAVTSQEGVVRADLNQMTKAKSKL